jgi:hypothetical protein
VPSLVDGYYRGGSRELPRNVTAVPASETDSDRVRHRCRGASSFPPSSCSFSLFTNRIIAGCDEQTPSLPSHRNDWQRVRVLSRLGVGVPLDVSSAAFDVPRCPGGPDSDFEYSTQAYTGYEPTSMRAIRARYNPYTQTRSRVDQLRRLGHSVDKVEFIVMGGTFLSLDVEYR